MIAKLELTKVTLERNDDEIIILLGWHFVIIITRIEIINIIMEGKLQNLPKRDHAKTESEQNSCFSLLLQYDFSSSTKWGTFLSPRDPWTAVDRQPTLSTNTTFCFSKLEREDKFIDANLSICTGDCFPIGFEVDGQLPCAKLQCTISVGAARMLSLKSVVILKLSTVVDTKQMGIVWQTWLFHLSLNENKTRQLLITNNREMSQGESYSIKISPVNPEGCLAKLGKWTMFSTLLRWDYLNGIRFKVSDETWNASWILNLISNRDANYVSIIWNRLLNYMDDSKFGFHQSMVWGLLTYHQRIIDTHLEAICKKKKSLSLGRSDPIVPFCQCSKIWSDRFGL